MINTLKKIMVATDFTKEATPALKAAALIAESAEAELVAVHVLEKLDVKYNFLIADIDAKLKAEATKSLDEVVAKLGAKGKVKASTMVRTGAPFEEIASAAISAKADLLVVGCGLPMGKKGSRVGHFGPVANHLAHKLPLDILFARDGSEGPFKRIIAAVDFSRCSKDALERACSLAKACGSKTVTAVHAYSIPDQYYYTGHTRKEVKAQVLAYAEKEAADWMKTVETYGVKVQMVYVEGAPATAIVKEAVAREAQVVVIGTHGRTASSAVLLGNVAERVIRTAHCSVWAERVEGQSMTFAKAISRLMGLE